MTDHVVYGKALFEAALESGEIEPVRAELETVCGVIEGEPGCVALFDTPALSRGEKHGAADAAFGDLSTLTLNFIKLLSDRSLFYIFGKAAGEYFRLYDMHHNIERAEAITARPMTEAQSAALCRTLESMLGKRVILQNTVDPQVLGGVRVICSGKQLDGSLRRRLSDLEQRLKIRLFKDYLVKK